MTSEKKTNAILSGILILIMVGTMLLPSSLLVSGFSDDGNFFETDDIAFWLNFNDDYTDKSVNRYSMAANGAVTYTDSFCYDERMVHSFPPSYIKYFWTNSAQAVTDLNLNNEETDCHIRMSMWVQSDQWHQNPGRPFSLLSKANINNNYYFGWELEIGQILGWGSIRLRISDQTNPLSTQIVELLPSDFNEENDFFFRPIFIRAGWDFFPDDGWGVAFIEAIIKEDNGFGNSDLCIYRASESIISLPISSSSQLHVGRSSIFTNDPNTNFGGYMDQVQISRGKPFELLINQGDYVNNPKSYWELHNTDKNCSLPHEDMIAYYNFENIEDKASIQYDQNCTMFFDGAHLTPHNGIIEGGIYDPAETTSWDGSTAFTLDGDVYGRVLEDVDGWDYSGGGFMLGGWSKDNREKVIEVGCAFMQEDASEGDMILLSKFAYEVIVGFPSQFIPYGYKIGIDSDGGLFATVAINKTEYTLQVTSPVQPDTWYRCLLRVEKYTPNDYDYHIDLNLTLWQLTGNGWIELSYTVYNYHHEYYYYAPPGGIVGWWINDISDPWNDKDVIIGGTWHTIHSDTVIDKFVGRIDDVKWFKSESYNVWDYDQFNVMGD